MTTASELATRRELLVRQCELDRLELVLAWHDLRRSLRLDRGGIAPGAGAHPWLRRAIGIVLPLVGAARARRLSRYLSFAVLGYRLFAAWRQRR